MFESDPDENINYSIDFTFKKKEEIPIQLWRDHFSRPIKERNASMNTIFNREYMTLKSKCCFLEESQIKGRTLDKFGIPNICGKIWKNFFHQSRKCKRVKHKFNKSNSVYSKNIFGPPNNISKPMIKIKVSSKTFSRYPPVAKRIHDNSAIELKISQKNVSLTQDLKNKMNEQEHDNNKHSYQDDVTDNLLINRNLNCPNQYTSVGLPCTSNLEKSENQKPPNKPPIDEAEINSKNSSNAFLITECKNRSSLHLKEKPKSGMKKTVRFNDEYLCRFAPSLNSSEDAEQVSYEEELFSDNLKITDNCVDIEQMSLNKQNEIHSTSKNISDLVTAHQESLKIEIQNTQSLTTDFIEQNQEVDKKYCLVQNKDEKVQNSYRCLGNHIKKYNIDIEPYEELIITEYSSSLSNEDREKEGLCSKSTLTNQQFKSLSIQQIKNATKQCFDEGNDFQLIMKNDKIQQICEEASFSSTQMNKSVIEETPSISQETDEKHEDMTICSNDETGDTLLHKSSNNNDSMQDLCIHFENLNPVEIKNNNSSHDFVDDYIPLSLPNSPEVISQSNTNEHSKQNLISNKIDRPSHDYSANVEEPNYNIFSKTNSENQNAALSPILSVTNQLYGSPSNSLSDRDYLSNISEYASEDKENNMTISNKEKVGYDNQIGNQNLKINLENCLNLTTILSNENAQIESKIDIGQQESEKTLHNLNSNSTFTNAYLNIPNTVNLLDQNENENQLNKKNLLYVCSNSFEITQSSTKMGITPFIENKSPIFENKQVENNGNVDHDSTTDNYVNDKTHENSHIFHNNTGISESPPKTNTSDENIYVPFNYISSTQLRSHTDLVDFNLTTELNAAETSSILDKKTVENLVVENSLLSKQSPTNTQMFYSEIKINKAVELSSSVLKWDSSDKDEDLLCSKNQNHNLSNDLQQDDYIILSPGSSLGSIAKGDLCLEHKTNEIDYDLIPLSQKCSVDKRINILSDNISAQEINNTASSDFNNENNSLENDFHSNETTANTIHNTPSSNSREITENMFKENNEILHESVHVQTSSIMEYSDTEIKITSTGSENGFLNSNFAMKSNLKQNFSNGKCNTTSSEQSYKKFDFPISTTYRESKTKRENKELNVSQHTQNNNLSATCNSFKNSLEIQRFPLQENTSYTIKSTPIKYMITSPITDCNKATNVQTKPQLHKIIREGILMNKQCTQMADDNKEYVKSKRSIRSSSINSCHEEDWNDVTCITPEDQIPPIKTYNCDMIDHDNILTVTSDNITSEGSIGKKEHFKENVPSYFQDKERERHLNGYSEQSKLKLEAITKVPITIKEVVMNKKQENNILNNFKENKLIQCLESNNNSVSKIQSYDKSINTTQKCEIAQESLNNKLNEAGEILLTSDSEKSLNDSKLKFAISSKIRVGLSQSKNEVSKNKTLSFTGYEDNGTRNVEVSGIIYDDVSPNQLLQAESLHRIECKHLINENKSSKITRTNIVQEEYRNNNTLNYSQSLKSKQFSHVTTKPLFLFCNQGKVHYPSSKLLCKTEKIPLCTATDISVKNTSDNLVTKENSKIDWNEKNYFNDESKEHYSTMCGSITNGTNKNSSKVTSYDASTLQLQKSTNCTNSQNSDVSKYTQNHNSSLSDYFCEEENNFSAGCNLLPENLKHSSTGNYLSEDSLSPNGRFDSDFENNHIETFFDEVNFSSKQIEKRKHLEQSSNQTSDSEDKDSSQKRMKYSSNTLISEDSNLELTRRNSFNSQSGHSQFEVMSNDSGSLKTDSAYPSLSDEDLDSLDPELEKETTDGNYIIELFPSCQLEDDSEDSMSCLSPSSRQSEDDFNF